MDFPGFKLDVAGLRQTKAPQPDFHYDLLIVGGGPAAMSAAIYAARKLLNLAVITKDFGGQMLETGEIENWLGARRIGARDLVDSFQEHVSDFDLPVSLGASVRSVRVEGEGFTIYTDEGKNFRGHSVIIATGKRHRPLGVPGEKEFAGKGVAYCATCDAPFFAGKKVVVAGGGNSAFTTALELLKAGASVTMVNFTPGWQADGVLQQKAGQFKKLKRLDRRQVLELTGKQRLEKVRVKNLVDGKTSAIAADGIFIEVGLISNSDLVKDLVQLNQQGEVVVDCACRTSREGVFAAGDVTTVPYKQIVVSAGEGAKAALSAHAYLFERNLV